jgi:hypothetical protein
MFVRPLERGIDCSLHASPLRRSSSFFAFSSLQQN